MERQFVLHTPLMWLGKAQTVTMVKDFGALEAFLSAITATIESSHHVVVVMLATFRIRHFPEAGVIDPLIESPKKVN